MKKGFLILFTAYMIFSLSSASSSAQSIYKDSKNPSGIMHYRALFQEFAGYKFPNANGFRGGFLRTKTMLEAGSFLAVPSQKKWEDDPFMQAQVTWENVLKSGEYRPINFTHPNVLWNDSTMKRTILDEAPAGGGAWDFVNQRIERYFAWADPEEILKLYACEEFFQELQKTKKRLLNLEEQLASSSKSKKQKYKRFHLKALISEAKDEEKKLTKKIRKRSRLYWQERTCVSQPPLAADLHYSYHPVELISDKEESRYYPRNPVGPTGFSGRGLLGKWGANHAADPLITQKGDDGQLYFLMIKRKDNGQWALPGGMLDTEEAGLPRGPMQAALRELFEEAGLDLSTQKNSAEVIYRGYVDDPRNTDNAWMETVVITSN